MPIEINARVTHSTFCAERYLLESNVETSKGLMAYENGKPIYIEINAEGGELHKWISKHKESFQLLHHVAVRDVRKGLFLVGNKKKIMFGVFVTYSDNLITSYCAVLQDLYNRILKLFYKEGVIQPETIQNIQQIIDTKEMKKLRMTFLSFETAFYIWRRL